MVRNEQKKRGTAGDADASSIRGTYMQLYYTQTLRKTQTDIRGKTLEVGNF